MTDIQASLSYYKPWLIFWLTVAASHIYFDIAMYKMFKRWFRGMRLKETGMKKIASILRIWVFEVFLQRHLFGLSYFRWFIHLLIFWGFIGLSMLSLTTFLIWVVGKINISNCINESLLYGKGYPIIKIWGSVFGLALLAGLMAASFRRFVIRPVQQINEQMDVALLLFLLWLVLSGFALEALRISIIDPDLARYSFVSWLFSPAGRFAQEDLSSVLTILWILHSFSGVLLLVYAPHSKLMHSLVAPLLIAINAVEDHERRDIYWPEVKRYKAKR